jgi:hypothetical protein
VYIDIKTCLARIDLQNFSRKIFVTGLIVKNVKEEEILTEHSVLGPPRGSVGIRIMSGSS